MHPRGPATPSVVTRKVARKSSQILLLRGINIGPNKRIAMPALREVLSAGGFKDVRTYVQSGNVVVSGGVPVSKAASKAAPHFTG